MLDCKELKEKLFHIYGRRIICRVGQGQPVYNATKEITQQPEADIAVYIQEKVRIAIVWDLAARKDYKKQIKNLSASESWDNIKPGKGELKVHYKRMGSSRDALFEKVLILDVDTLNFILEDLPLYLKVDPDDETCPQAVRQNEKEYDIPPAEVRKRISTSRWERDWSFRNKVLAAYGFKCAICRCDEENLLEAAHIRSVADGGSDDVKNGIYVDRLVEAGYIGRRTTDDITHYVATPKAKYYKKSELLKALSPVIKAASEGITTAT